MPAGENIGIFVIYRATVINKDFLTVNMEVN